MGQLRRAQAAARIVSVQNQFNRGLLVSEDVLDACEAEGIAFFPWSPLGEGLGEPADELRWLLDRSPVDAADPGHLERRAPRGEHARRRVAREAAPALVPLSHDHHHTLVRARDLREAAGAATSRRGRRRRPASSRHFGLHVVRHFREEEELVFPLLALQPPELERVLVEHQRIRVLAGRLRRDARRRDAGRARLAARGAHPAGGADRLRARAGARAGGGAGGAQAGAAEERPDAGGPVWGAATEDLNATLLVWPPGEGPAEHVNEDRDVLYVVLAGGGELRLDGEPRRLHEGDALVVEKGVSRALLRPGRAGSATSRPTCAARGSR